MPFARGRNAIAILAILAHCHPFMGMASRDAAELCTAAAARAANQTGVPYEVLLAISVVETGRDFRPWPWTVNLGGEGHWLDTLAAAEALADQAISQGLTNIDLGCFQLNYRWYASGFASVTAMLDPGANALHAAEYLAKHHARTGDWATAAAAYHSATPEFAERYQAKFEATWSALAGAIAEPVMLASSAVHRNRFPFLTAGQPGSRGSLVPDTAGGQRLIGEP